jgi:lipopolysaccharide transport system permease protein
MIIVKSLYRNRMLIQELVRRDLKMRYLGSTLGFIWAIIHPVLSLAIYTVIFSVVLKVPMGRDASTFSFVLYLFCGLLPWLTFQEALTRSVGCIPENANLVQKMKFPIEVLVPVLSLSSFIQQLIGTAIFFLLLLASSRFPGISILLLPLIFLFQLMAMVGLSWLVSSLYLYFRDISQVLGIALNVWFWLTPLVYPQEKAPPVFQWVLTLNPMTHLVGICRALILEGNPATFLSWAYVAAFGGLCFLMGMVVLKRLKPDFPDLI